MQQALQYRIKMILPRKTLEFADNGFRACGRLSCLMILQDLYKITSVYMMARHDNP